MVKDFAHPQHLQDLVPPRVGEPPLKEDPPNQPGVKGGGPF